MRWKPACSNSIHNRIIAHMLILLFTGLSGAGKSTLAAALQQKLEQADYKVAVIDGDQYRNTLNKDLGFSEADRRENIRRLMLVAKEKKEEGFISIIAAISPFEDQRLQLSSDATTFVVYIKCSLDVLIERDTKGLYKRALLPGGHPDKLSNLTGVNDRYDIPALPDLTIDTAGEPAAISATRLYDFVIMKMGMLSS